VKCNRGYGPGHESAPLRPDSGLEERDVTREVR